MSRIFLLSLLLFCAGAARTEALRINLSEAIKRGVVTATVTATGKSYKTKGLQVKLTSKNGTAIRVMVDAGSIFKPEDAAYQPLLLVGGEMLLLQPWQEGQTEVQTFCANSGASAPVANLKYTFSGMASDTLIKALDYVKKNFLLDDLGQSAVWVFTNGHDLKQVYDPARDRASKLLIDQISVLTGKPKPDYYMVAKTSDAAGQPVYVPKSLKIIAEFEQVLTEPKALTLGVFDASGKMIQPVFENRTFGKNGHRFRVDFQASNVTAGNYFIRLLEGTQVIQEKKVLVQ